MCANWCIFLNTFLSEIQYLAPYTKTKTSVHEVTVTYLQEFLSPNPRVGLEWQGSWEPRPVVKTLINISEDSVIRR